MIQNNSDSTTKGALIGLILPAIIMSIFILVSSSRFDSIGVTIKYYQTFDILYKVLSLSLMPGAGLFFLWSKNNKLNQARGTLLMTMFYGIFVLILYMS